MNRNTVFGIIIGGIITFICSYIFFGLGTMKREPVYSIVNSSSIIFDKTNSSPKIKILVNDSLSISENIYVTTLMFWNNGKLSINNEDIRKDFFIYCSDTKSQILDYKILEKKDSSISNFRLNQIGNMLQIKWDYFDPRYGFKTQIIYSGDNETKIIIKGEALDSQVKQVNAVSQIKKEDSIFIFVLLILMILLVSSMWIIHINHFESKPFGRWSKGVTIFMTIVVIGFIIYSIFHLFLAKLPF